MSIPRIPGYTTSDRSESLGDLWTPPPGDHPTELWPEHTLNGIIAAPTDWVQIEEYYFDDHRHGGRGAVLIDAADVPLALKDDTWLGRDLGSVGLWTDRDGYRQFDNGLTVRDRDIEVDFLVKVRHQHSLRDPIVEISHSFLWYWDAIRSDDGWYHLDEAGQDQQLVRCTVTMDAWRIEVRALELRRYLADAQQALVAQVDHVTKVAGVTFQETEFSFRNDWAIFSWWCSADLLAGDKPHTSRLLGKYIINGSMNAVSPRWDHSDKDTSYPEFVYGIDTNTGGLLKHTCDPDRLGSYFDGNDSHIHYLTPVNFSPDVLSKYTAEPDRYHVEPGYLRCLDLWGVQFCFNTAGLVEVYLGDIGRDIPSREWSHWLNFNVRPEGQMSEDRFRRDFLAQFASGDHPTADMKRLRVEVNSHAKALLDCSIWRELDEPDRTEFERLFPGTTTQSLKLAILLLCKALVEAIDQRSIVKYLGSSIPEESRLSSLERLVDSLGGNRAVLEPLRALQQVRSKAGIAHLASSQRPNALARLGIDGMGRFAFEVGVRAVGVRG